MKIASRPSAPSKNVVSMEFTEEQCFEIDEYLAKELRENEDIIQEQYDCIALLSEETLFQAAELEKQRVRVIELTTITQNLIRENIKLALERDELQGTLERVFS